MASKNLTIITELEDRASDEVEGMQDTIQGMEGTFNAMAKWGTAAFAAIGTAAFEATRRTANYADEILDASSVTQMATDTLQEYRYVADMAGISQTSFEDASATLTRQMTDLKEGTGKATDAVNDLGVAVEDGEGNFRGQEAIFEDIIGELSQMEDATERNRLATELFRGSARDLIPALDQGGDQIEKWKNEAHDAGAVLDEDTLDEMDEFRMALVELTTSATGLGKAIGTALAPMLTSIAEWLTPIVHSIREWMEDNESLVAGITVFALTLSGLIAVIGTIMSLFIALSVASKALAAAKAGLAIAAGAVSASMLLIPLAIMAVIAVGYMLIKHWDEISAFAIRVWEGIKEMFFSFVNTITELFIGYFEWYIGIWKSVFEAIFGLVGSGIDTITGFFGSLWENIIGIFQSGKDMIMGIVDDILGFPGDIADALQSIPGLGGLIETGLNVTGVNDAMITSKGDIVEFHPDDDILAMKDFGKLGGGSKVVNLSVHLEGGYYLDRNAGRKIAETLRDEFGKQIRQT